MAASFSECWTAAMLCNNRLLLNTSKCAAKLINLATASCQIKTVASQLQFIPACEMDFNPVHIVYMHMYNILAIYYYIICPRVYSNHNVFEMNLVGMV